ncbi:hypothetical protein, partial [Hominenteromicrobium sp.]
CSSLRLDFKTIIMVSLSFLCRGPVVRPQAARPAMKKAEPLTAPLRHFVLKIAEDPVSAQKPRPSPDKRHPGYSHTTKSTRCKIVCCNTL